LKRFTVLSVFKEKKGKKIYHSKELRKHAGGDFCDVIKVPLLN